MKRSFRSIVGDAFDVVFNLGFVSGAAILALLVWGMIGAGTGNAALGFGAYLLSMFGWFLLVWQETHRYSLFKALSEQPTGVLVGAGAGMVAGTVCLIALAYVAAFVIAIIVTALFLIGVAVALFNA